MDAKFNVKLESLSDKEVNIRFYSSENIELIIKDKKYFSANGECKNDEKEIHPIFLDNSYKIISFVFDTSTIDIITFIAVDKTNKEKYAIRVQFSNKEVDFTKMMYDED